MWLGEYICNSFICAVDMFDTKNVLVENITMKVKQLNCHGVLNPMWQLGSLADSIQAALFSKT